jgi:signal transduction histidine kinase
MKRLPGILAQMGKAWELWLTPHTTDPAILFRERIIRGMIPLLLLMLVAGYAIAGRNSILARSPLWAIVFPAMLLISIGSLAALYRRQITIAGWLIFLLPTLGAVSSLWLMGYWSPIGVTLALVAMMLGAVVLPRSVIMLLPIGTILTYAAIAFRLYTLGLSASSSAASPLFNPVSATFTFSILTLIFFGIDYYLLSEFERQHRQLKLLIDTLEVRVEARTRYLNTAADISAVAVTELAVDKLLTRLAERTREGFDLNNAALYLIDDDDQSLWFEAGSGTRKQDLPKKYNVLTGKDPIPQAARTRSLVMTSPPHHLLYLEAQHSELCLPMVIGDKLFGVLELQCAHSERFERDGLQALLALSKQLAVAIQNALLFEQQAIVAEKLRSVDSMKSQFLASMSHELRTPLNAILNFTEFVAMGMLGPVTDKQKDALKKAQDSGQVLLGLINDVLDITKIESGTLNLFVNEAVDVNVELTGVVETAQELFKERPITFVQDIDHHLPTLTVDRRRLRQILLNLISNAAKFTKAGSVTLSATQTEQEILFAVIDTGPGIAMENQLSIFEPFIQTSAGIRHRGGSGLGLALCKGLVEAHGGRIWLESEMDHGAAFFVALPVRPPLTLQILAHPPSTQLEPNNV